MMAVDLVVEYVLIREKVQDLNRERVDEVMDKVLWDDWGLMASE
jgi:hypothetical protein